MGKRTVLTAALCMAVASIVSAADGPARETLELKNGNAIRGEVLREKADTVVVDLGFTVLSVPTDLVAARRKEGAKTADKSPGDGGVIYHEAGPNTLKEKSVKDLADELGESVVLVTTPAGLGSGFLIDDKGYVVTNFHVISGEQEISVTLFRKEDMVMERKKINKVKIVAINPYIDLALLKMELPAGLKPRWVYLGGSESVRDGQSVFAIGNPLGLERTVSEGIVSTMRRNFNGQLFVQTTAPINPGNSGGPLFNLRGEVIGVTNMKAGFMSEGLSFAIPVDTLKFFLRNRDVFAFDKDNPNTGYHYLPPPRKKSAGDGDTTREREKAASPK